MSEQQHSIKQLSSAYIFYRTQGATPDFALQSLKKLRPSISPQEREELVNFIRIWEGSEGYSYAPIPNQPITPWQPSATDDTPPPSINQMRGTRQLSLETLKASQNNSDVQGLVLTVKGYEQSPLAIKFGDKHEFMLGRSNVDSILLPDVDLKEYGAEAMGVSRAHATLRYQDKVVTIADMGSVNHTFINGEMLHPQEIRLLPDGSEVHLGRLAMRIVYRY